MNFFKRLFWVLLDLYKCTASGAIKFVSVIVQVILGERDSFRNYKGFSIIFPRILDVI